MTFYNSSHITSILTVPPPRLIQKAVSKRVVLRNTPKLTFKHDNSAQRGVAMVNLLDDIEQNLPKAPPLPEGEFDPEI